MANSNTYSFNPAIGSMALNAFGRCQIRRTELTPQHLDDAYSETNYLQSNWSSKGITFWTVEFVQQSLTQGVATYNVPANAVQVLDVYISTTGSSNRLITSFSRTDFASLADPTEQGFPTSYWFQKLLPPTTLTLWPVPDGGGPYTMNYYYYSQPQDAVARQGGNAAIPYYWLDAFVAALAWRLARIYAPDLEERRKADADAAYADAASQVEVVPLYIQPGLQGYYRP